jgi:hypothetical protein
MPDDGLGGPPERSAGHYYAEVRIATFRWRLRLGGTVILGVHLMAGESVALLFAASLAAAFIVMAGGSALARLEVRIGTIRQERRR